MTPTVQISREQIEKALTVLNKQTPGLPSSYVEELKKEGLQVDPKVRESYSPEREVFLFTYKKGHSIITIHFQSASLADAVREGKEVCRVKRWTWVGVTPFLRDIKRMMEEE